MPPPAMPALPPEVPEAPAERAAAFVPAPQLPHVPPVPQVPAAQQPAPATPDPELGALSIADLREAARLEILRSLERGEVDVETASQHLEILEEAGPRSFRGW